MQSIKADFCVQFLSDGIVRCDARDKVKVEQQTF